MARKRSGHAPSGNLVSVSLLCSSLRCSYNRHTCITNSSSGVRTISGEVCAGMMSVENFSEYSFQQTPAEVRPALPALCFAEARLVQTVTSSLMRVEGLKRLSLTLPVSITWETSASRITGNEILVERKVQSTALSTYLGL